MLWNFSIRDAYKWNWPPPSFMNLGHIGNKIAFKTSYVRKILIFMLCVYFVSVCLKVQKWTQTDIKVTFHPPTHYSPWNFLPSSVKKWTQTDIKFTFHQTHHPPKVFGVNERYGHNKTFFLLWCYGIDLAPIKRYCQFFF